MSAKRNLQLITPYLASSLEGASHGFYLLWLSVHRGISPFAAAAMLAAGDLPLLVLDVPAGIFADRLGARRSLLLGSGFQALGDRPVLAGPLARRAGYRRARHRARRCVPSRRRRSTGLPIVRRDR